MTQSPATINMTLCDDCLSASSVESSNLGPPPAIRRVNTLTPSSFQQQRHSIATTADAAVAVVAEEGRSSPGPAARVSPGASLYYCSGPPQLPSAAPANSISISISNGNGNGFPGSGGSSSLARRWPSSLSLSPLPSQPLRAQCAAPTAAAAVRPRSPLCPSGSFSHFTVNGARVRYLPRSIDAATPPTKAQPSIIIGNSIHGSNSSSGRKGASFASSSGSSSSTGSFISTVLPLLSASTSSVSPCAVARPPADDLFTGDAYIAFFADGSGPDGCPFDTCADDHSTTGAVAAAAAAGCGLSFSEPTARSLVNPAAARAFTRDGARRGTSMGSVVVMAAPDTH